MMGKVTSVCAAFIPRKERLAMPTAPSVPSTTESARLYPARMRLFFSAATRPLVSFKRPA